MFSKIKKKKEVISLEIKYSQERKNEEEIFTGDVIQGEVELKIENSKYGIRMTKMQIWLKGKEIIDQHILKDNQINKPNEIEFLRIPYNLIRFNKSSTSTISVPENQKEISEENDEEGKEGEILGNGKFQFPFYFRIPSWAPATIQVGSFATIRWFLATKIEGFQIFKANKISKANKKEKSFSQKKCKYLRISKRVFSGLPIEVTREFSLNGTEKFPFMKGVLKIDIQLKRSILFKKKKKTKHHHSPFAVGLFKGKNKIEKEILDEKEEKKYGNYITIELRNGTKKRVNEITVFLERKVFILQKNGDLVAIDKRNKLNKKIYKLGVDGNSTSKHIIEYELTDDEKSLCSSIIYGGEEQDKEKSMEEEILIKNISFPPKYHSSIIQYGEVFSIRYKLHVVIGKIEKEFDVFIFDYPKEEIFLEKEKEDIKKKTEKLEIPQDKHNRFDSYDDFDLSKTEKKNIIKKFTGIFIKKKVENRDKRGLIHSDF